MKERGIKVPVAWGHQPAAEPDDPLETDNSAEAVSRREYLRSSRNAGYLEAINFDPKTGWLSVDADIPAAEKVDENGNILVWTQLPDGRRVLTAIREVSAGIRDWRDGQGQWWKDSLIHLALCTLPVVDSQTGFSEVRSNPEVTLSTWSDGEYSQPQLVALSLWLLAAEHAPRGGIDIQGKHYRGGQWIPGSVVESATPEEQAKLKATKETGRQKLKAAHGPEGPDLGKLRESLAEHAGTELKEHHLSQARRTYAGIRGYHGDLALHRLHEGIQSDLEKFQGLQAGPEKTALGRRLAAWNQMLDWHEAAGKKAKVDFLKSKTGVKTVPLDQLHVDPKRFQYKLNTDASGVVREGSALEGSDKFNPLFSNVISVWHDPADGKDYVINGHHRYDRARRSKAPDIDVKYIPSSVAKDAQEARAIGALQNIADGRGTAVDAAKYFRDTGSTPEDMAQHGISLAGPIVKDAVILKGLRSDLFDQLTIGRLPMKQALAIGSIPSEDAQKQFHNYLQQQGDLTERDLSEMAREIREAPEVEDTKSGEGGGLFAGLEEQPGKKNLFLERNQLKAALRANLSSEANTFRSLTTDKKAQKLKRGQNVINPEENRRIATEAEQHKNTFDTLANRKGPISDAINRAAEELYDRPKQRKQIEARLHDEIRGLVASEIDAGAKSSALPVGEGTPGERAVASGTPGQREPAGAEGGTTEAGETLREGERPVEEPAAPAGGPATHPETGEQLREGERPVEGPTVPASQEPTAPAEKPVYMPSAAQITKPKPSAQLSTGQGRGPNIGVATSIRNSDRSRSPARSRPQPILLSTDVNLVVTSPESIGQKKTREEEKAALSGNDDPGLDSPDSGKVLQQQSELLRSAPDLTEEDFDLGKQAEQECAYYNCDYPTFLDHSGKGCCEKWDAAVGKTTKVLSKTAEHYWPTVVYHYRASGGKIQVPEYPHEEDPMNELPAGLERTELATEETTTEHTEHTEKKPEERDEEEKPEEEEDESEEHEEVEPDEDDHKYGKLAKAEKEAYDQNPASFVEDEGTWEKAKKAACKTCDESEDKYWPTVTSIYKRMGGSIKGKKTEMSTRAPLQETRPATVLATDIPSPLRRILQRGALNLGKPPGGTLALPPGSEALSLLGGPQFMTPPAEESSKSAPDWIREAHQAAEARLAAHELATAAPTKPAPVQLAADPPFPPKKKKPGDATEEDASAPADGNTETPDEGSQPSPEEPGAGTEDDTASKDADEENLFDEEDIVGGGQEPPAPKDAAPDMPEEPAAEPTPEEVAANSSLLGNGENELKEAVMDAAKLGLVLPANLKDPKEFIKAFCVAAKTLFAKGERDKKEQQEANAPPPAENTQEEQRPIMMNTGAGRNGVYLSTETASTPTEKMLLEREEKATRKRLDAKINALVKRGMPIHRANHYRQLASTYNLSLTSDGRTVRREVDVALAAWDEALEGVKFSDTYLQQHTSEAERPDIRPPEPEVEKAEMEKAAAAEAERVSRK